MASADLSKELECPVCLNIYTDPVILKCGHNFCQKCIDRELNTQKPSGRYSCPACKKQFPRRPALQKNAALKNIAESFRSTQPEQKGSSTSVEIRKCSVHKKILQYYCTEDAACICVSCRLDGGHWGHQVETVDEASEKKKKKLRNDLQKFMAETKEAEKRVQSLEERRRQAEEQADGEKERVTALFRDLRRQLEDLEKRVLNDITRQVQCYDDIIRQLEVKKEELSRKMRHIEELCNMTDPLTVLQESDTGDLCDTEDRERHDKQLHDGGDLDLAAISNILHTGLSDILSGVIEKKRTYTQAYPHSSPEDKGPITAKRPRKGRQPTPKFEHVQPKAEETKIEALQQTSGLLAVYEDISLDVNTTGKNLHVSSDGKTLSWSDRDENRPETPEKFQSVPQVLSSRSFSSGRHYWEVDVGGSRSWRVGMCYPSIARRGAQSVIGCNNKSWCLYRQNNQYLVIHDRKEIQLPDKIPSGRVRISLDYEAGQISFYALRDPIRHLHTFTTTFAEPLHAALWVVNGCVTISGGNQQK
ncbi:E3 ubiquitin-protein ligase TRIM11-like [Hyperolius riggenbachi]|uniref:E3 ubiquitin-protein ligase TRIM11-like n=1 Tax=Hyperolius riggenbachi TaxID=752182 RepID=UPI0035A2E357